MRFQELTTPINFRPYSTNLKEDIRDILFQISNSDGYYKVDLKCTEEEKKLLKLPNEIIFSCDVNGDYVGSPTEQWFINNISKKIKELYSPQV